jgi:hypothetical protein
VSINGPSVGRCGRGPWSVGQNRSRRSVVRGIKTGPCPSVKCGP